MPAPLRVLVCIPHFYQRSNAAVREVGAENGSATDAIAERVSVLSYCLQHLAAQLRRGRFIVGSSGNVSPEGVELGMDHVDVAPPAVVGSIAIQCVPDDNLADQLPLNFAIAHLCNIHPRFLGYRCRQRFAEEIDNYDLFCFIEDDTAIIDPNFFLKVRAFYDHFGEDRIVLPSRFELIGRADNSFRSHLDGPLMRVQRVPLNMEAPPELVANDFTGPTRFVLTESVLSGCYVLTPGQVRRWMTQPDFMSPVESLLERGFDPLEMTQIPLMGTLPIYRPAPENLSFLEVHHVPNRLSQARTTGVKIVNAIRQHQLSLRS